MNPVSITERLEIYRQRIDTRLASQLPPVSGDALRLKEAMRYSTLLGGKRIRPALVYATLEALETPCDRGDAVAAAVELIHAYSLIHDDLPAMDNDDLRRGQPTCHRQFDEATAILAGDTLQTLAFEVLANTDTLEAPAKVRCIQLLTHASGTQGMAAGQMMDLEAEQRQLSLPELERIHRLKTGALIEAAVLMAACVAGCNDTPAQQALSRYASCVGLAFQVHDDVLDVTGDTETLGKTHGSDLALQKCTFPAIMGLAQAQAYARQLIDEAIECLTGLGAESTPLADLARYVVARAH